MIEIKIDKNNKYETKTTGTVQELLENIRVLDTARERILGNIKEKTVKDLKKMMPNISTKVHESMTEKVIRETLESITVLSEVGKNE